MKDTAARLDDQLGGTRGDRYGTATVSVLLLRAYNRICPPPDVASLLYTTCIDGKPEMQHSQENFCHTKCSRDRLHSAVKLYAVDVMEFSMEGGN
jgi:hypothetical protein